MKDLPWDDPLGLDLLLSEEERVFHDAARAFARETLEPRISENFRSGRFDRSLMQAMGEIGLFGILASPDYGGSGASHASYGLVTRAIEAVDSAYRSSMSVQSSLVIHPVEAFGSEEQKKRYLPDLIRGTLVGCFGLSEAQGGSDPGAMRTTAQRTSNGYVLNGEKMWITNAPVADVAVVWAMLEGKVRGFIVDTRGLEGFSAPIIEGKLSLCASVTGSLVFTDCEVPSAALLPGVAGLRGPFSCLNKARYGIAWGTMGAAESCWKMARDYTLQRKLFNRPLAATQLVQKKLADFQTRISLGLLGAWRLGRLLDEGHPALSALSMMKRENCTTALEVARTARDMLGGNGITEEYQVMRHLINMEAVSTYEGTGDVHALIMGRAQTGLAAF